MPTHTAAPLAAPLGAVTLTPSEVVLLHGEKFARKAVLGERLVGGETRVNGAELATAMIAAAVLGNAARGRVTLAVHAERTLLGILSRPVLVVTAARATGAPWPAGSLEERIVETLGNARIECGRLMYGVLGHDTADPHAALFADAKAALAARNVLAQAEKRGFGATPGARFGLTATGEAAAAACSAASASALFDDSARERPEEWDALRRAARRAFTTRTASAS